MIQSITTKIVISLFIFFLYCCFYFWFVYIFFNLFSLLMYVLCFMLFKLMFWLWIKFKRDHLSKLFIRKIIYNFWELIPTNTKDFQTFERWTFCHQHCQLLTCIPYRHGQSSQWSQKSSFVAWPLVSFWLVFPLVQFTSLMMSLMISFDLICYHFLLI